MADKDLVTMGVVKALLEVQANAFKEFFRLMFDDMKDEIRNVKKDLVDLKESLSILTGSARYDHEVNPGIGSKNILP